MPIKMGDTTMLRIKSRCSNSLLLIPVILVCGSLLFASDAQAQSQKRDHLTEQEVDLVRENQELDKRIEVFIKAADRRLLVLTNPNATQKKKKEEEDWGPLPRGNPARTAHRLQTHFGRGRGETR